MSASVAVAVFESEPDGGDSVRVAAHPSPTNTGSTVGGNCTPSRRANSGVGSVFETPGPVWHKKDKEAGIVPEGLHGLDREADWIQSSYHGWVYGYKVHVTTSVSSATVRIVLDATVTGSACESHVLRERVENLPPTIETLLLDAGYDDGKLIERCAECGMTVLAPLAKPIGRSTSQTRRERAAYLASDAGKAWYKQREASIEPFFDTIKDFFVLDPLPVLDGFGAIAELRQDPQIADIPVILLSAQKDPTIVDHGLQLGAVAYLFKPYNHAVLLSTIRAQIGD